MKISELDEGVLDWFKADKQADMKNDVVPMVKQLLDQGMSEDEVITKVEQELGVRPRYIRQAIGMVRAGLAETATAGATSAGGIAGTANGFASGGIGTISRADPRPKVKTKPKNKTNNSNSR